MLDSNCMKMDLYKPEILACPLCLAALQLSSAEMICEKCAARYEVRAGVPMLCRDKNFYYGEIPRNEMNSVIAETKERGWQAALWRFSRHRGSDYFVNYVTSDSRAAFKFILSQFGEADILDYGCGLGNLTMNLATSFRSVVGIDLAYERAAFTSLRAQQDGISNVSVICAGDTDHIPLKNASVDVVVLNGVLEWIPEWLKGDPRRRQVEFLKEFRRVLRPNGQIFIGIENRAAYRYFTGHPEDHTRLLFASLLPRRMANAYSRMVRKKPFRTYTYTRRGYVSLLREAAFERPKFYGLLPNYREIRRIVDFSKPEMRAASLGDTTLRKKIRNVALRHLLPSIIHSYGITANCRPAPSPSFIEELALHLGRERPGGPFAVDRVSASACTPTVQLRARNATERLMIRLPLTPYMEGRLRWDYKVLAEVRRTMDDRFRGVIPEAIGTGNFKGQFYSVVSYLPGVNLGERKDLVFGMLPAFCDFAVHFALKTRQPCTSWRCLIHDVAKSAAMELLAACRQKIPKLQDLSNRLDAIAETLAEAAPDTPGFACALHGDFWVGNVLVHSGRVSGILDWDCFQSHCVPGIDWVDFLASEVRVTQGRGAQNEYVELFEKLRTTGLQSRLLSHYCSSVGMNNAMHPVLVVLAWLCKTAKNISIPDRIQVNEVFQNNVVNASKYFSALGQIKAVNEPRDLKSRAIGSTVDQALLRTTRESPM
jgi:SAM-dependent methyltransferase